SAAGKARAMACKRDQSRGRHVQNQTGTCHKIGMSSLLFVVITCSSSGHISDTAGLLRWEVWRALPSKKHLVFMSHPVFNTVAARAWECAAHSHALAATKYSGRMCSFGAALRPRTSTCDQQIGIVRPR